MIYCHFLFLTYSVGSVCGLLFYCGVPPGVQVDDIVRAGQIQAQSVSFQTYYEYVFLILLECIHHFGPLGNRGGAVQVEIIISGLVQTLVYHIQEGCELAENQDSVAT